MNVEIVLAAPGRVTAQPSFWRWVAAVSAGEALGFLIPAIVGASLAVTDSSTSIVYPSMILAGAAEGALLGTGQAIGLGKARFAPAWSWISSTAIGAALAWSIGLYPSTFGFDFRMPLAVPIAVIGAALLLSTIPTLQWLVFRHRDRRTALWIPLNIGAWAIAILWTVLPSPFIDGHTPIAVIVAIYSAAGLFMAVTVAMLSGLAMRRLYRNLPRSNPSTLSSRGGC
jgi:hypothetical protein